LDSLNADCKSAASPASETKTTCAVVGKVRQVITENNRARCHTLIIAWLSRRAAPGLRGAGGPTPLHSTRVRAWDSVPPSPQFLAGLRARPQTFPTPKPEGVTRPHAPPSCPRPPCPCAQSCRGPARPLRSPRKPRGPQPRGRPGGQQPPPICATPDPRVASRPLPAPGPAPPRQATPLRACIAEPDAASATCWCLRGAMGVTRHAHDAPHAGPGRGRPQAVLRAVGGTGGWRGTADSQLRERRGRGAAGSPPTAPLLGDRGVGTSPSNRGPGKEGPGAVPRGLGAAGHRQQQARRLGSSGFSASYRNIIYYCTLYVIHCRLYIVYCIIYYIIYTIIYIQLCIYAIIYILYRYTIIYII